MSSPAKRSRSTATRESKAAKPGSKKAGSRPKARRTGNLHPNAGLVKALSHPVRMRLLARFNEEVLSPVELAREFELSVPLVSYHVKILRELDCIELVSETPRRGAVEHHYRATRRAVYSDQEWAALGIDARQSMTGAVIRDAVSDALDALQTGDMDRRSDRHVSFTTFDLDEESWAELNEKLVTLIDEAMELQAQTAGRRAAGLEAPGVRSRLTILHYEPVAGRPSTGVQPTPRAKGRKSARSARARAR